MNSLSCIDIIALDYERAFFITKEYWDVNEKTSQDLLHFFYSFRSLLVFREFNKL